MTRAVACQRDYRVAAWIAGGVTGRAKRVSVVRPMDWLRMLP